MKFTYKPVEKTIAESYAYHTQEDIFADGEYLIPARIIVEADSEEEAYKYRTYFSDVRHWELESVEE